MVLVLTFFQFFSIFRLPNVIVMEVVDSTSLANSLAQFGIAILFREEASDEEIERTRRGRGGISEIER